MEPGSCTACLFYASYGQGHGAVCDMSSTAARYETLLLESVSLQEQTTWLFTLVPV